MSELQIQLFGSPNILQDQKPVTGFVSSKATALVYYLAATNRMHSRDSLAALLWADVPEARAKKNLRDILSNLRKVMGSHLDITRQTVALTVSTESVDVCQFDVLISGFGQSGQDLSTQQQAADLAHAATLQSGEFLEGFYVSDAPLYEEWVLTERERLGQLGLQVFNQLITRAMHSGNYTEGLNYALRSLALAPLEEETHRQLMSIYVANGQYAAALEQYERCCELLYDELGAEPSLETTELFESIQNRQENPFTQQINDDHLLPFVGRADELAEINRLLARSDCRLLTLVGLGGVGKTRLARQAAIRNQHRFLDGTYLIEAGAQYSIDQCVTELANTLGLSLDLSTDEDAASQLLDYLRTKSMLIIIDNAEFLKPSPFTEPVAVSNSQSHRAGVANSPLDLLHMISASAPAVQLIATSRERLDLRSEWVFDVGGLSSSTLSLQHEGRPSSSILVHDRIEETTSKSGVSKLGVSKPDVSKPELLKSDAFQLFLHRGRQAWGNFPQSDDELTQTDLAAIGSICQLMDGMPLAIELAASWVSMLSCKEIQDEVTQGMDLLASTARDLPERHRSLHAVFDHSWQMLSAIEQDVLERLSLFAGGFNRNAAQQIAGASLPILQNLMQRSFLTRTGKERFCLHNLLQQYAYQRLSKRPTVLDETQELHARYFSDLLLQYQDAFLGEQTALISKLIDDEGDNVRAAFEWAVVNGQIALLEQMVDGIYQIYVARSWLAEGIDRLRHAVEQLGKVSDPAKETEPPENMRVWAKLQIRLGWLLQLLGKHEDAQSHLDIGLHWATNGDESIEKGLCLLGQAHMHFELANYDDAQEAGQQSLDLYRQQRNQIGETRSLYILGKIRLAIGEYRTARQNLSQALSLAQVRELRSTEAECLGVLGQICWNQGDNGAAQGYFEEALAIFQLPQMANQLSKARILNELGFVSWSQGRYAQAEEYHTQARQIFYRFGNRQGEGTTLSHLGRVAERYKSYADAARLYEQAVVLNREIQDRQGEAISIANLAFVAYRQIDYARAEDEFGQCRDLCNVIGFRRYEALAIACLGLLACFRNDFVIAVKLARDAIDLAQQIQDPIMEAYGWIHLGYALAAEAKWDEAASAYERSLLLRRGAKDTERLLDPLAGLAYIALQHDDLKTAQRHTDEILTRLNAHTLPSALFPAQIHYVCYRVLSQNDEPEAEHYLQVAKRTLQEYKNSASLRGNEDGYLGEPIIHESLI